MHPDHPFPPRALDDAEMAFWRTRAHRAALGGDWSRVDDAAVLEFVAWAAPAHGDGAGPALQRVVPKITVAAAAPPASPSRATRAAAAPAAAAAATLGPDVDAAATAQNLRDAANEGVPFCEECARAGASA